MARATVCLCMIVRNEAAVIERCLASVRSLIDHWVICDTGSTDGTPERVREGLVGIPGVVLHRPWVDIAHNRAEAIGLAGGQADYLLLLDADMTVQQLGPLPALTADSYRLPVVEGDGVSRVKCLVRGEREWRCVGSAHARLEMPGSERAERLELLVVQHHRDGGSRADKLAADVESLAAEIERSPEDARATFLLAETLRELGERERAAELYDRRSRMEGPEEDAEEVYCALLAFGELRDELGDWPGAMDALARAWEARPRRMEACRELAARLRERGQYYTAHLFAAGVLGQPMPDDLLQVRPWVYHWGLLFEYSITSYWVGDARASLQACDRLLELRELPPAYREQTVTNRTYAVRRLAEQSSRRPAQAPAPARGRGGGGATSTTSTTSTSSTRRRP
jgi:tetratricopeptide (TPR) repeat protein